MQHGAIIVSSLNLKVIHMEELQTANWNIFPTEGFNKPRRS
jgi:hypothetical protein